MTVKLGDTDINKIYLGDTEIKKVYLGDTLIYDTTGGTPPASITYPVWLDSTSSDSYGGTGQTWSAYDGDDSAQTDFDCHFGTSQTVTTDDPTFVGTAGTSTAYMSCSSGDLFLQKDVTNTDVYKNIGSEPFTIILFASNFSGTTHRWLSTGMRGTTTAHNGIVLGYGSSKIFAEMYDGSSTVKAGINSSASAPGGNQCIAISHDGTNLSIDYFGTRYSVACAYDTGSTDGLELIINGYWGYNALTVNGSPAGMRVYRVETHDSALTSTEVAARKTAIGTLHGRTYY